MRDERCDSLIIEGARIVDPYCSRDAVGDVFVDRGLISARTSPGSKRIDGRGLILCPGLVDMHVHLREPGQTHKETIATGTAAAAAGGFTYVACMPNTSPAIDTPEIVRFVRKQAAETGFCEVGPVAAITRGRSGIELTDLAALLDAGAVGFSDDGVGVEDYRVMLAAFEQAARLDAVLIQHCEYKSISAGGVMHKGTVSARIGLPGLDPRSEEAMIERDIDICRRTGGRYHVAHISTAKAVELVRAAKAEGLPVTTEVCTHHLTLTDEACAMADPNTKMHPPLRPMEDVLACRAGLLDGTIDCVVTDHAPHAPEEKTAGFLKAPAGIIGLETALGLTVLAMKDKADWMRIVNWFTVQPDRILKRKRVGIQPGARADLTLIDPESPMTYRVSASQSKSRNCPFDGWELPVRIVGTMLGERLITTTSL